MQRNIICPRPITGVWMWLFTKLVNKPLESGERDAAQPLDWQLSLVLLGSHGSLKGVKVKNTSRYLFFLLFLKCRWMIFHFAEGAFLLLGSLSHVQSPMHCISKEGTNPAPSWNSDKILRLKCHFAHNGVHWTYWVSLYISINPNNPGRSCFAKHFALKSPFHCLCRETGSQSAGKDEVPCAGAAVTGGRKRCFISQWVSKSICMMWMQLAWSHLPFRSLALSLLTFTFE